MFKRKSSYLVFSLLLLLIPLWTYAKMYRWIDEEGNVRYSDQIPPDQVQHRRETLNKEARIIDILEKKKTAEQLALEKRLAALRQQQEEIIAKQQAKDKVLLSTFRNVSDMELALKGKTLALESQKRLLQANLDRLNVQLQQDQKRAAQFERDGKPVPGDLQKDISKTQQQIEQAEGEITKHNEKTQLAIKEFEADIDRYQFLTQSTTESTELSQKTAQNLAENQLGLFICASEPQCLDAWQAAKRFVLQNSTTGLDVETENLIMTLTPRNDQDLSLSVSKITEKRPQLFLDIRCRNSSVGNELCSSPKVQTIRQSFSTFIKSELGLE
jgi:cytochrome b involved in lipid metabolism